MVLGRKGIIFSLLAIGLSSLFIIYFSSYYELPLDNSNLMVQTRVRTLNDGIDSFVDYSQDALVISGYTALQNMYENIGSTSPPVYFSSFEDNFTKCALNGTYDNHAHTSCGNANNFKALLQEEADRLYTSMRIDLVPTINSLNLTGESWWYFTLSANITYEVDDEYASWFGYKNFTVKVPKEGLYDPAALLIAHNYTFTPSFFTSPHRRITPNTMQDVLWNITYFKRYFKGREYRQSNEGPCLSQRYEGDWSAPASGSDCGIETLINPNEYVLLNPIISDNDNLSHTDYQILRRIEYLCFDTAKPNATFLVVITGFPVALSSDIASRFNIEDQWTQSGGKYTAPPCD